ncbi:sulfite exporter TauE/SafE family protein [Chitinophaga lutea]
MLHTMIGALLLGFFGSFHCIGMCGPIALTLPVQHLSGARKALGILLYNAGRVTSYAVIGGLFGWMGRQFFIGGLQQWLSIGAGIALLASLVFFRTLPSPKMTWLKSALGRLLLQRRFGTLYSIGVLNGLLPCGLVYVAIAGAATSGSVTAGMTFMAAFGAGTIPAMAAAAWFAQLIGPAFRRRVYRLTPVIVAGMATLLILRGMNLGIPYISPILEPTHNECCHKPS